MSIFSLFTQGDGISRFVAILLLAMSVASWVVILWKAWLLQRATGDVARSTAVFWQSPSVDDAQSQVAGFDREGLVLPLGLLGTVWGIYHALTGIAGAGQISIDKVAGPVGEALIMTAAGLAVAIPAVLAYNVYGRRIGRIEADLEGFARDLLDLLVKQSRSGN